jgi:hypothetical protein
VIDLLHIAALIGATLIVVRGTLFHPIQRRWPALFECSQCTGMWIGMAAGASGVVAAGHGRAVDALVVGAATSFLSLGADAVLMKLLGDPST